MRKQIVFTCLFIFLFILLSFSQNKIVKADSIKISGTALNAKAGAVVKIKSGNIYYIDGISSWNDDIVNKTVEVKGFLKKEIFKKEDLQNEKGEWSQGMIGEKLTIIKPVWKKN